MLLVSLCTYYDSVNMYCRMLLIGLLRLFGESKSQFTLEKIMAYMESMKRDAEKHDVPQVS